MSYHIVKVLRKCEIPTCTQKSKKKTKKPTITQISRKRCIGRKNATLSFLCGSSRAIQRFLFQVATTNSFRVMTENVDLSESEKHKIANISKTVHRTKKSMSSIFVRLVERNPMVFIECQLFLLQS